MPLDWIEWDGLMQEIAIAHIVCSGQSVGILCEKDVGGVGRHREDVGPEVQTRECKTGIKKNLCLEASGENDWTEFSVKCKLHMERFMKYRQIIIVK
jgi:hypothetical protein